MKYCRACHRPYECKPVNAIKTEHCWMFRCVQCTSTLTWEFKPGDEKLPNQEFETPAWLE